MMVMPRDKLPTLHPAGVRYQGCELYLAVPDGAPADIITTQFQWFMEDIIDERDKFLGISPLARLRSTEDGITS